MKPAPFGYHAPRTVEECVALLAELGDEAKVLAGGQSLVPMLALRLARPEHLVDVNRIPALAGARLDGDDLTVGATTRHAALEKDPVVARAAPLLHLAAPYIGHVQIRNRGTIGGSLAHADAAAELPAVTLALDADIELTSLTGTRTVPATQFFETTFTTALRPDELLTAVRLPGWGPRSGFALEEVARRHGDFALAGVACGVRLSAAGRIERAAVALIGLGSVPVRAQQVEKQLLGAAPEDLDETALAALGAAAVEGLDPPSDVHADGRYRTAVAATLVARALARAFDNTHQPEVVRA